MLKLLLLVVMVVTSTWSKASEDFEKLPKAWPCPEENPPEACICIIDDIDTTLSLDCSAATSNDALAQYFQKDFPIEIFKELFIRPTTPAIALDTLHSTTFGVLQFTNVEISNTNIRVIEDEAFAYSHSLMQKLFLQDNQLETFPYETLKLYTELGELDLSNNQLALLPDLESSTISILRLNGNTGLTIGQTTFAGCLALEELYLSQMGLTAVIDNFLVQMNNIRFIDLSMNLLSGELPENTINPTFGTLQTVLLRDNGLTNVHHYAITSKPINQLLHLLVYITF